MTPHRLEDLEEISHPITNVLIKLGQHRVKIDEKTEIDAVKNLLSDYSDTEISHHLSFILQHQTTCQASTPFAIFFFLTNRLQLIVEANKIFSPPGNDFPLITESFFSLDFISLIIKMDINLLPSLFTFQTASFNYNYLYASRDDRAGFITLFHGLDLSDQELVRTYFLSLFRHYHSNGTELSNLNTSYSFSSFLLLILSNLAPPSYPEEWIKLLTPTDDEMAEHLSADLERYLPQQSNDPKHNRYYYRPLGFIKAVLQIPSLTSAALRTNRVKLFPYCDFEVVRNNNPEAFVCF